MSSTTTASRPFGVFKRARPVRASSVSRSQGDDSSSFGPLLVLFLACVAGLLLWGWSFYTTPLPERYLHPQYPLLKSSGPVGLLLGVVGTVMMLLSLVYVLSKRSKILQKVGTPAQWLQVHIFFGFAGPVLVTLHTAGKIGGLVSVAFYAMWLIVLSGIVGRYIYSKLPRTIKGTEMTLKEMEAQLQGMVVPPGNALLSEGGLLRVIGRLLREDLELPWTACRVFRIIAADHGLPPRRRLEMTRLVLRQQRLLTRLAVYDRTKQIFSYWHVFHRPFILVTVVLVFLHVVTALYFGYGPSW